MSADLIVPRPDTLQVGWLWFQVLLTTTFVVHILLMNALFGGAVVTFLGGVFGQGATKEAARNIAKKTPTLVALTVNAGVAPLLFLQVLYGHLFYTSSIVMAAWWFAVIPLLIIAYYATYAVSLRYESALRPFWSLLVVGILATVGFLFVNNNTLALTPGSWTSWFSNGQGTGLNISEPTLFPRWLHMMVGALAVGGLFVALLQQRKMSRSGSREVAARDWALKFFTHGTLAQVALGIWWLIALPRPVMMLFMGTDMPATVLFLAGLAFSVVAVILGFKKKVYAAAVFTVITVIVMALIREVVRFAYLDGIFHPAKLSIEPQNSSLVLFMVTLVIGVISAVYMLVLSTRTRKEG
ncbi:MAG: hypothetical protein CSA32_01930 [Desulfobulbus propionicus]|nr:MAG: hypothetical protein CSA32_01930 [Desulfobulbus propionicus]